MVKRLKVGLCKRIYDFFYDFQMETRYGVYEAGLGHLSLNFYFYFFGAFIVNLVPGSWPKTP